MNGNKPEPEFNEEDYAASVLETRKSEAIYEWQEIDHDYCRNVPQEACPACQELQQLEADMLYDRMKEESL